jgi:hypothetical protein
MYSLPKQMMHPSKNFKKNLAAQMIAHHSKRLPMELFSDTFEM